MHHGLNNKNIPYYLIELSLAKSLEEIFLVLDDTLPRNNINFKELQTKCVFAQLCKLYRSRKKDIHQIINLIFHLKDDIALEQNLLNDIYIVDNDRDLYLSNLIELKDLESFFFNGSVPRYGRKVKHRVHAKTNRASSNFVEHYNPGGRNNDLELSQQKILDNTRATIMEQRSNLKPGDKCYQPKNKWNF